MELLTLNVPSISESYWNKNLVRFLFSLFFVAFKTFKAFLELFEAPQRSVKIKILLNFFSSSGIGTGRVKRFKNIIMIFRIKGPSKWKYEITGIGVLKVGTSVTWSKAAFSKILI